jgi:hypothetical protein
MVSLRTCLYVAVFSAVALQADAETRGMPIAVSPVTRTALGATPVTIALAAQTHGAATDAGQCYIAIEGLTADRPVGTGYNISIAIGRGHPTAIGSLNFYEAIGVSPADTVPVSFEVPLAYCAAANKDKISVTIAPDSRPVAGSNPLIGVVKLIAQ